MAFWLVERRRCLTGGAPSLYIRKKDSTYSIQQVGPIKGNSILLIDVD